MVGAALRGRRFCAAEPSEKLFFDVGAAMECRPLQR